MLNKDLVIIGGGSAGMAAALKAFEDGIKDILIIEKDDHLGGILNQCIHNGFGLTEFKEELTGPEYMTRFSDLIKKNQIEYKLYSTVLNLTKDLIVTYSNEIDGIVEIKAKAVILATGCLERNAGAIQLPGDRPSGVITAGAAQKYLNLNGYLVGKRVVILGSGDIGLIMARRMTLEGAKVLAVLELMPYSNGLNRNIVQCLNDFNIPLYLSTSISKVIGKNKVEKVIASKVDKNFNFIPNTEMEFECDTLLLSVGLLPNVSLLNSIGCKISSTRGPEVDEHMQTNIPGLFACGNCLHVHDLVDFVSQEGRSAGHGAALYIKNCAIRKDIKNISVMNGENISYVVPQHIDLNDNEDIQLKFRVRKPMKNVIIKVMHGDVILRQVVKTAIIPSEMEMIQIDRKVINNTNFSNILVEIKEK